MCEDPPKPVQAPLLKRIIIALLPGEFDEKLTTAVSWVPRCYRRRSKSFRRGSGNPARYRFEAPDFAREAAPR